MPHQFTDAQFAIAVTALVIAVIFVAEYFRRRKVRTAALRSSSHS